MYIKIKSLNINIIMISSLRFRWSSTPGDVLVPFDPSWDSMPQLLSAVQTCLADTLINSTVTVKQIDLYDNTDDEMVKDIREFNKFKKVLINPFYIDGGYFFVTATITEIVMAHPVLPLDYDPDRARIDLKYYTDMRDSSKGSDTLASLLLEHMLSICVGLRPLQNQHTPVARKNINLQKCDPKLNPPACFQFLVRITGGTLKCLQLMGEDDLPVLDAAASLTIAKLQDHAKLLPCVLDCQIDAFDLKNGMKVFLRVTREFCNHLLDEKASSTSLDHAALRHSGDRCPGRQSGAACGPCAGAGSEGGHGHTREGVLREEAYFFGAGAGLGYMGP